MLWNRLVMVGACVLAVGMFTSLAAQEDGGEEFIIDNWDFSWRVMEMGDVSLRIEKSDEKLVVAIVRDYRGLRFAPDDAELLAPALEKTDSYFKQMRGSDDASESIEVGKYKVGFQQSAKYGFSVTISEVESFMGSPILLSRQEANAIVPHLKKARAMASFVDRKILPD
jgi:hypothetical protein